MEGLRRHGAGQLRVMVAQYQEEDGGGAHCGAIWQVRDGSVGFPMGDEGWQHWLSNGWWCVKKLLERT